MLLLFAECHPRQGDWYESIRTGRRIKVEGLGTGRQLCAQLEKWNSDTMLVRISGAEEIFIDRWDSNEACFWYQDLGYHIVPVKELDDYVRLETGK